MSDSESSGGEQTIEQLLGSVREGVDRITNLMDALQVEETNRNARYRAALAEIPELESERQKLIAEINRAYEVHSSMNKKIADKRERAARLRRIVEDTRKMFQDAGIPFDEDE